LLPAFALAAMRAIIGKHQKHERLIAPRAAALKIQKFVAK
jgi:hypothetical protein